MWHCHIGMSMGKEKGATLSGDPLPSTVLLQSLRPNARGRSPHCRTEGIHGVRVGRGL